MAPTPPGFQGLNHQLQYIASHPYNIIYYTSNYYDASNYTRLILSGTQFEDYTTYNSIQRNHDLDQAIILNMRQSFSGIINTIIGVYVCWKVHIQPYAASDYTDGKMRFM